MPIEKQETPETNTSQLKTEPTLTVEEVKSIASQALSDVAKEKSLNQVNKSNLPQVEEISAVKTKAQKNAEIRKFIKEANNKGLTEATASSGTAVATPVTLSSEILRKMTETGVVRRNARIIPMETMTLVYRVTDTEGEASWAGQITARDATNNTYVDVTFTRTNLGKTELVGNALLQDAGTDLEAHLSSVGSTALRKGEDKACFLGNGSNITGLVNETTTNEVELVGTITQGALTYQKILDLVNTGDFERTENEKLYMNRRTWSQIQGLEDTNGNLVSGTDNVLNPNWKGIPVEMVQCMVDPVASDGTNKTYVVYGDLNNVGLAVRNDESIGIRVSDSAVVGGVSCWDTRQTAFAFDEDVDLKTLIPSNFNVLRSAH